MGVIDKLKLHLKIAWHNLWSDHKLIKRNKVAISKNEHTTEIELELDM